MTKKVLIINTGGTIAMVNTNSGLQPKKNIISDLVDQAPEFSHHEMPDFDLLMLQPLIDSANMNINKWNAIAETIRDNASNYDGFLILHGTDTMAYTASMLSFTLQCLGKPVILTGSQIPISKLRNDAKDNLINALLFAAMPEIREVCIYFNHKLFRGNRTIKCSAEGFSAFDSPNYPVLATVGVDITIDRDCLLENTALPLDFTELSAKSVVSLRLYPGMTEDLLKLIVSQPPEALIVEAFGKGTMPSLNNEMAKQFALLRKQGIPIIVCSQCPQATVVFSSYEASQVFMDIGALSAGEMTFEACVTKTLFLLNRNHTIDEFNRAVLNSIVGER